MCGIAGIVGKKITDDDEKIVEKMKTILRYRGPDDEGIARSEYFCFGHQRLSIIDLKTGRQPMHTEDGRFSIVFNGEIYNYIELRRELQKKGLRFRTSSDTEVLLKLIAHEGLDAVKKLNGMFAFALFDRKNKTLLAARDPFGIKPFYYTKTPKGNFLFASEIKALLCHPKVTARVCREALQEYLTFQFCLKNKTLFKNIFKLEPGHTLQLNMGSGNLQIKKYWELDYSVDTHHTEKYFADRILEILRDALRLQLRSDVPIGSYLSGGLDSSAVAFLASEKYQGAFRCFHGHFKEGAAYDELHYAKEMASTIHCKLDKITPTARDFIKYLPELIYHMDEPAAGPGLFPQYLVSKLAAKNVKVVLAGTGGDEIFGGYARYSLAYLEQCLKGAIFETQEEGKYIVTLDTIIPNLNVLKEYVPLLKNFWQDGLFDDMDKRYFRLINRSPDLPGLLRPEISRSWNQKRMFSEFQDVFHNPKTKSYLNKMTHFDQKTLLPALLQVEDRVSMACSLESRVPLLDTRLVNLITRMPPSMKFQKGKNKYILRKALRHTLPKNILNRTDKMGFPVPLKEWSQGPIRNFIKEMILSKDSRVRSIFKPDALEKISRNEERFGRQLWGALCLELWFRKFNVKW